MLLGWTDAGQVHIVENGGASVVSEKRWGAGCRKGFMGEEVFHRLVGAGGDEMRA